MTKKKSAKRSFISSVLVLCLCFTMLVGTTFAWYTDSVTSGRNTIVAGSLDLTVEYFSAGTDFANGTWTEVNSTTPVFADSTSFEPGATQVAYVRVKNTGDLAFKYKLSIAVDSEVIGKNKTGGDIKLSDYLYYGTAAATAPYGARSDAISAVDGTKAKITSAQLSESQLLTANATSGVIAIVIYMPEDTGNEANPDPAYKPSITFGLNAIATQYTEEEDSFGKTYDANAEYPAPAEASQTVTDASAPLVVEAGAFSVTVPANATEAGDVYTVKATDVTTSTDANDESTVSFDLSLYKNGTKIETPTDGVSYPVEINIGAGKTVTGVTHNSQPVTSYDYDVTTGTLTFTAESFSPFAITFISNDVIVTSGSVTEVKSLAGFRDAWNNGEYTSAATVKLVRDVKLSGSNWTPIGDTSGHVFNAKFDGQEYTISNLTIDIPSGTYKGLFGYVGGGNTEIKNVKLSNVYINATKRIAGLAAEVIGDATFLNCSIDSASTVIGSDANIAGLIGEFNPSVNSSVYCEKLNNYATIIGTGGAATTCRAAGVCCQTTTTSGAVNDITFKDCHNYGSVTVQGAYAGGITCAVQGADCVETFDGCTNSGTLTGAYTGDLNAFLTGNRHEIVIEDYSDDPSTAIGTLQHGNHNNVYYIKIISNSTKLYAYQCVKNAPTVTFASLYSGATPISASLLNDTRTLAAYAIEKDELDRSGATRGTTGNSTYEEILYNALFGVGTAVHGDLIAESNDIPTYINPRYAISQHNAEKGTTWTEEYFRPGWTSDTLYVVDYQTFTGTGQGVQGGIPNPPAFP